MLFFKHALTPNPQINSRVASNGSLTSLAPATYTGPGFPANNLTWQNGQPMPQAAGYPGFVLQSDLLQYLGPILTARSDTFIIRGYGDVADTDTHEPLATALCEAVVQRVPDPIPSSTGGSVDEELAQPTHPLGRKFVITSFRWIDL